MKDYEVQILHLLGRGSLKHWRAWAEKNGLEYEVEKLDELVTHNGLSYQFKLTVKGILELVPEKEKQLLDQLDSRFAFVHSNIGFERGISKEVVVHVSPKRGEWSGRPRRNKNRRFAARTR